MKRLIRFALLVGAIGVAARLVASKKAEWEAEWQGLTEDQVRERINDRAPDRVPAEKLEAMTDKVLATMRSRGWLAEE